MKIVVAVFLAVACGLGLGSCTAVRKIRQHPWLGGIGGPDVAVGGQADLDDEEFDFGRMDFMEKGKHDFTITNRGDRKLTLSPGTSSCSCTVSDFKNTELAPGQSTKVSVTWKSKGHVGRFRQSVSIITSDPLRPEIVLKVQGEFTHSAYTDPDELNFGQIAGNKPVTQEGRVFCNLPSQQVKVLRHELSDPSFKNFFQVDYVPLAPDELRKYEGVTSGVLVRVTIKPGLPLGRFQQRIQLITNVETVAKIDLPVFGSVGEVTLVGPGWNSDSGVLDIGTVDGQSAMQRNLILLARGANAKEMKYKVARVEPSFLKVKLGETTVTSTGDVSQTELSIEIPESKSLEKNVSVNYLGGEHGKLGEILLETIGPQVHSLRVRVRFAVVGKI